MNNCTNCKWCEPDAYYPEDHVCCNDKSEHVADWVDEESVCEEYEACD